MKIPCQPFIPTISTCIHSYWSIKCKVVKIFKCIFHRKFMSRNRSETYFLPSDTLTSTNCGTHPKKQHICFLMPTYVKMWWKSTPSITHIIFFLYKLVPYIHLLVRTWSFSHNRQTFIPDTQVLYPSLLFSLSITVRHFPRCIFLFTM